jgi:acyl carrier protein
MDEFLEQLREVLDLERVDGTEVLEDLPEWDSLTALSVIAMIDANYRVNLSAGELKGGLTGQALSRLVQAKRKP